MCLYLPVVPPRNHHQNGSGLAQLNNNASHVGAIAAIVFRDSWQLKVETCLVIFFSPRRDASPQTFLLCLVEKRWLEKVVACTKLKFTLHGVETWGTLQFDAIRRISGYGGNRRS